MTKFRSKGKGSARKIYPITGKNSSSKYNTPKIKSHENSVEYKGMKVFFRPYDDGFVAQVPVISSQYLGAGKTRDEAFEDAKDSIDKYNLKTKAKSEKDYPKMTPIKRTFEAKKYPKGSEERKELNRNVVTSEYIPSEKYVIFWGNQPFDETFKTRKMAEFKIEQDKKYYPEKFK